MARRIDAVEAALGAPVVVRGPTGWTLTEVGEAVAAAAVEVENALQRLEVASRGHDGGVVRLTAPAFFARQFLIPAMGRFTAVHPEIDLRLLTTNAVLDLGRREADVAIRNFRPEKDFLVRRRLGLLGARVYASRAYVARRGMPARREDLAGHHLVVYEGDKPIFQAELAWLSDVAPVALRATDTLTVLDATLAGLGIAPLPCAVGDVEPELVRVDVCGHGLDEIGCLYLEEQRRLPRIRAVVDWLGALWEENAALLAG